VPGNLPDRKAMISDSSDAGGGTTPRTPMRRERARSRDLRPCQACPRTHEAHAGAGCLSDEAVAAKAGRVWLAPGKGDVTGHVGGESDLVTVHEAHLVARVHPLAVDEGPVG
jgi:hypothetical protein